MCVLFFPTDGWAYYFFKAKLLGRLIGIKPVVDLTIMHREGWLKSVVAFSTVYFLWLICFTIDSSARLDLNILEKGVHLTQLRKVAEFTDIRPAQDGITR